MASLGTQVAVVEVSSVTVMRGDVINIGGQPFKVVDLTELPGRAKRLHFVTGETLTMHSSTQLSAVRTARRR
ncbi:hypothetical protein J7I98_14550 [Streptomyces sp. ISL-98]|uniref:hypothetical protein n=1 Tax=Streptomyces sp. ISL-98 TaxID=2819192 RepID=UPI001BECCD6D|nr:hypothetical protein [Streptomyces sp. ISL-98]MBT2507086.1 hypothetical protein [Streptomyces sp. ISL-98]